MIERRVIGGNVSCDPSPTHGDTVRLLADGGRRRETRPRSPGFGVRDTRPATRCVYVADQDDHGRDDPASEGRSAAIGRFRRPLIAACEMFSPRRRPCTRIVRIDAWSPWGRSLVLLPVARPPGVRSAFRLHTDSLRLDALVQIAPPKRGRPAAVGRIATWEAIHRSQVSMDETGNRLHAERVPAS